MREITTRKGKSVRCFDGSLDIIGQGTLVVLNFYKLVLVQLGTVKKFKTALIL